MEKSKKLSIIGIAIGLVGAVVEGMALMAGIEESKAEFKAELREEQRKAQRDNQGV